MRILSILILLACLISCTSRDKKVRIVASKGLPSELLLVVDDKVWQSDLADTLKAITQGSVPGLIIHYPDKYLSVFFAEIQTVNNAMQDHSVFTASERHLCVRSIKAAV
jgi:hypothetical protein